MLRHSSRFRRASSSERAASSKRLKAASFTKSELAAGIAALCSHKAPDDTRVEDFISRARAEGHGWREVRDCGETTDYYLVGDDEYAKYRFTHPRPCAASLAGDHVDCWFNKDGRRHRLRGPAATTYHTDGRCEVAWYRDGLEHREGAPSLVYVDRRGVRVEQWCRNGTLHRGDGPAIQAYNSDGDPTWCCYYLNGERFDDQREYEVVLCLMDA